MSTPIPAPRTNLGAKKPVPAPRTTIPIRTEEEPTQNTYQEVIQLQNENEGKNTFRRKVKTLSNDIGGRVNEGKKAVIETTRQSVRKITRRFTNNFTDSLTSQDVSKSQQKEDLNVNIFSSIRFDSPIGRTPESIYSNVSSDLSSDNGKKTNVANNKSSFRSTRNARKSNSSYAGDDEDDVPPPPYPPPALPQLEETYDVPSGSIASESTTSSEEMRIRPRHVDYESVFPSYPYNSDSDGCIDMTTAGTIERHVRMDRSSSWNFYDTAPKDALLDKSNQHKDKDKDKDKEPTYNNVDSTPTMSTTTTSTSDRSFLRNNSLYENWEPGKPVNQNPSPTRSVLLEFDPFANTGTTMTQAEELSELEKILQGELDGSLNMDNLSIFDDASDVAEDFYISPPPPPMRTDSLLDSESVAASPKLERKPSTTSAKEGVRRSNFYLDSGTSTACVTITENKPTESKSQKIMNKLNKLVAKIPVAAFNKKDNVVQRPMIQTKRGIQQKGMLFKIMNGPVEDLFGELSARWCVLQPGVLLCHSDNSCDNIKENIPIESILSIQVMQDQKLKYKHEEDELFCFELNTAGKVRAGYIYGTKSQSERRIWMQNLADNMCHTFGSRITSDYKRIGWTYMKVGVNGQWKGAWICLVRRKLYYIDDNASVKTLDLRKARCFKLEPYDEVSNPTTTDKGANIVIHFTSETYYFRMWTQRETKVWCHIIKLAARDNGPNLNQQQLTKNDVPVIVEKCINFVYVHGSMTEGIYRRAGSNTTVAELMNQFRTDAWSVQLTNKYTSHDVANVLKRFFRDLAEPLIDVGKRQYLYQVSLVKSKDERVRMYKGIFDQVHKITYNTTRRLLGHLYFISTQCNKNLMNIVNLASIWGPTLLHGSADDGNKDRVIIAQLIELYNHIFPEDPRERDQERKMLSILQKYSNSPQGSVNVKPSGDFRVWVYLYNKEGKTFNMLVGPNKTAYEILCELSGKVNVLVHELVLEELVLNDHLTRPIHHSEKVLDVVMKWGYWDDTDRKDNCLILNNFSKYWEYLNDNNLPLSAELKYADNKTLRFKLYKFEFQQAKLTYFKDRNSNNMLGQWNVEEIFLYFGSEPKRYANGAMTFFPRNEYPKRNKTRPFFGHVLSFPDPSMKATWVSSMWRAEHQHNVTPPPQHVNLMSS